MELHALSDESLLSRMAGHRDTHALGEFYDRFSGKVYGKLLTILHDEAAAMDLTHDIFLKVFLRAGTFQGKAKAGTWLYAITYHSAMDWIEKQRKHGTVGLEDYMTESADDQHEAALLDTQVKVLNQVLAELEADDRALLLMKYMEEMSIAEICEVLGISESAVKMRLLRARSRAVDLRNQILSHL